MDSEFDLETFMGREVDDSSETRYTPCPEGDYTGIIDGVKCRGVTKQGSIITDIVWAVDDQTVRDATGMDNPTVRQTVFVDVENGAIAFGQNKNVQLGRLREAVGQNQAGKPWSLRMLEGGGPALIHVEHRANPDNPDDVFADVKRVTKAA